MWLEAPDEHLVLESWSRVVATEMVEEVTGDVFGRGTLEIVLIDYIQA